MSDENEYLKEEFDYHKLTIPLLRGILNKHDVQIPPHTTRKADYVKLYETAIVPNLKSLRKQYLHPNPSSENIHDASPRGRSASPIRRSTRLRSQSPEKRVASAGSARSKRSLAPPEENASVPESPRRRKINKKVSLPDDLQELAPNVDEIRVRGPRTRSKSPIRMTEADLAAGLKETTRSPRKRRVPAEAAADPATRGRTPRRETTQSNATTPTKKASSAHKSSPFTQENVFQSSRKRTSDHLGHKEDRPHKVAARSSATAPEAEIKSDEEVDVMAQFTNFSESELIPVEEATEEIKMEVDEKPRVVSERRGFMPSLQALNVSNIFAQRLAPDPMSTPELSSALPTDTENDADIEVDATPAAPEPETPVEIKEEQSITEQSIEEVASSRPHVSQYFFSAINTALVAFTALVAATMLVWWPAERSKLGFCDTTLVPPTRDYPWFASFSLSDPYLQQVQEYVRHGVDYVAPSCYPCPEHATCFANTEIKCDEGYIERRDLFALLGFYGPWCERDVETERLLATLAERAVHVLRNRRARYECDGDIPSPEMTEDELYYELLALKAPQLSEEDFRALWDSVSAGLNQYPDVEMVSLQKFEPRNKLTQVFPRNCPPAETAQYHDDEDDNGYRGETECVESSPIFVSHSLAHVNILCRFRLSMFVWLEERKFTILYVLSLFVFLSVVGSFLAFRQRHNRQVAKSVHAAIALMRAQQHKADNDRTGRTDRFYVAGPLFEHVPKSLRDDVAATLQRHKNVVYGQKEIKQGEIATIYEWTGL